MAQEIFEIGREELAEKLETKAPDNVDRAKGWALVNVLDPETFEREHIPGSANIPQNELAEFEQRFARDKDIVVYCASPECEASKKVARELAARGFSHVFDYPGGVSDWKEGSRETVGADAGG